MGGASTTPVVVAHLATLESGTVIDRKQLAEATGLDQTQVQAVMYRLAKQDDPPVKVISRGLLWQTLTPAEDIDDGSAVAFDVIERLGDSLVLGDGDGGLWLAKRIGRTQ